METKISLNKENNSKEEFEKICKNFIESIFEKIKEDLKNSNPEISNEVNSWKSFSPESVSENQYTICDFTISWTKKEIKKEIKIGFIMKNNEVKTTKFLKSRELYSLLDKLSSEDPHLNNINLKKDILWDKLKRREEAFRNFIEEEILDLITKKELNDLISGDEFI